MLKVFINDTLEIIDEGALQVNTSTTTDRNGLPLLTCSLNALPLQQYLQAVDSGNGSSSDGSRKGSGGNSTRIQSAINLLRPLVELRTYSDSDITTAESLLDSISSSVNSSSLHSSISPIKMLYSVK